MDWLPIVKECAQRIKRDALPLYSTPNANISFGRGAGGDTMKKIDLVAEKAIIDTLEERGVSCVLISEETGTKKIGRPPHEYYLTTDPIDGTTNALRGIPFIATSIAISKAPFLQEVETALVADLIHDSIYTATRGKGAFKEEDEIKPSSTSSLEKAVIGVDLKALETPKLVKRLAEVMQKTRHLRHLGANALEVCYVADGTSEAFIDMRGKLRVTDVAAAYLILKEAGGIMATLEGKEANVQLAPTQRVSFIAAANNAIYKVIRKSLSLA